MLVGPLSPRHGASSGGLQIWRIAANILNKQSRTADKWWPSSLGVGRGLTTPHRKNKVTKSYKGPRTWTDALGRPKARIMDMIFGTWNWIHLAQDRDRWRALVNTVMSLRVP
jgi:hypothetical protein